MSELEDKSFSVVHEVLRSAIEDFDFAGSPDLQAENVRGLVSLCEIWLQHHEEWIKSLKPILEIDDLADRLDDKDWQFVLSGQERGVEERQLLQHLEDCWTDLCNYEREVLSGKHDGQWGAAIGQAIEVLRTRDLYDTPKGRACVAWNTRETP